MDDFLWNTTLHKPAAHDSSLLDIIASFLHERKSMRQDQGSKGSLRAKGGPQRTRKSANKSSVTSGATGVIPFFPCTTSPFPCSSSFKVVGQLWPDKHVWRNLGEIKAYIEWVAANCISCDYQALTYTKTTQNNVNEKEHQNLVQKPAFKSWYPAWFPCKVWLNTPEASFSDL